MSSWYFPRVCFGSHKHLTLFKPFTTVVVYLIIGRFYYKHYGPRSDCSRRSMGFIVFASILKAFSSSRIYKCIYSCRYLLRVYFIGHKHVNSVQAIQDKHLIADLMKYFCRLYCKQYLLFTPKNIRNTRHYPKLFQILATPPKYSHSVHWS